MACLSLANLQSRIAIGNSSDCRKNTALFVRERKQIQHHLTIGLHPRLCGEERALSSVIIMYNVFFSFRWRGSSFFHLHSSWGFKSLVYLFWGLRANNPALPRRFYMTPIFQRADVMIRNEKIKMVKRIYESALVSLRISSSRRP